MANHQITIEISRFGPLWIARGFGLRAVSLRKWRAVRSVFAQYERRKWGLELEARTREARP